MPVDSGPDQGGVSGGGRVGFLRGVGDIAPIVVATIPFGLVFGAIAAKDGLSATDATLLSAFTFAGASQFAALQFWAHPLPFWTILLSVSAVNLRLLLYSASLARRIAHWPPWLRYCGLAFLTDPTFALSELHGGARLNAAYYFGLSLPLYANWIVTTAAGFLFGRLIENPEAIGLDFIVAAYFIHIVAGFRGRPNSLAVISASAIAAVLAYVTAGPPWHFAAGAAAGIAAAALLAPRSAEAL